MSKAGAAIMTSSGSALKTMEGDPFYIMSAIADLGVKEYVGKKHNPLIVKFFAAIKMAGIKDDETPWCAAFVGAKLEIAGIKSTRSAWALSYAKFGVESVAQRGAIGYKKRFNSAGKLIGGHVFFVLGQTASGKILALGGNQGNAVSVVSYDRKDIVGYRMPVGTPSRDTLPILAFNGSGATTEA